MSIEKSAVSALKWTAGLRLAGQLASWLSTLFVLRLLTPQDYGLMAVVATLTGIGIAIADFGLSNSMIQARTLARDMQAKLAGMIVALHLVMMLIVMATAPVAAWFFRDDRLLSLLLVASLQYAFAAAAAVPHALAIRAMNFSWLARVELLTVVLGSLSTLAMAIHGAGVWALVGGMLVTAATRTLLLVTSGENIRPSFHFAGMHSHLSYSTNMAASQVVWNVASQSDVMIGGRVLGSTALGAYSVGLHLATLPMQKIMSVINQVAFAAVARLQDETERLRLRLTQATRTLALSAVGPMWGLAAVAPELVRLIIGGKWQEAILPLQLISVVVPLRMLSMVLATAVAGVGAAHVNLRNTLTTAIVWPLCFVVGAQWGANGLAASWLFAAPLTFVLNARRTGNALGLHMGNLLRTVWSPVAAGLVMFMVIVALRAVSADWNDLSRLISMVCTGALAYVLAVRLLDNQLLQEVRRLITTARG